MEPGGLDVVTGAFSYTGRHIATRLLAAGRRVRTLTGHPDRANPFGPGVLALPYRFDDPAALTRCLRGADTLYNTYWVRMRRGQVSHERATEQSRLLFRAAAQAGVRRVVHVSITGADPSSTLPYFRGKGRTEEALRASCPSHAILRPALIFGPEDVLLHNIAWLLRRMPVFGVFGDGRYRLSPIHVEDLADMAVAAAAQSGPTQADAVGPETLTFEELVRGIAAAIGRRPRIVHVPPATAWLAGALVGSVVGDVVVTRDEIAGLMAGLLASSAPPAGQRRLSEWLTANGDTLGGVWASESRRHYRA